jgi:hypothetical protein
VRGCTFHLLDDSTGGGGPKSDFAARTIVLTKLHSDFLDPSRGLWREALNEIMRKGRSVFGEHYSMGLFKLFKKTDDRITQFQKTVTQVQKTVSDQYGTWPVRHSQKLAHELVGVTLNEPEEAMLIDCLTGGHLTYLNYTSPQK